MEEIKVRELPVKQSLKSTDYIVIEDQDGTKTVSAKNLRSLVLTSLYFNNIEELKQSSGASLKDGDIVETLGYYQPGDGGGAKYLIQYDPAAVADDKMVHYLSYSDTMRAKLILGDKINVHQFGAVGDGIKDDTYAIQAAFDHSENRLVEFSNNKVYVTRDTVKINKSNVVVKGNGAILFPYFVTGLEISTEPDSEYIVSNISITELNFDCSKNAKALYIENAAKIDITSSVITGVKSGGIHVANSLFINIDKCRFSGLNDGSLIVLTGKSRNINAGEFEITPLSSRMINITNCYFEDFLKAINILSMGSVDETLNTLVNLVNCYYCSKVPNSYGIHISCPVEMVNIDSNTVECCNTFLCFGSASKGNVSCRDLSCAKTSILFDVGSADGVLNLSGNLNTDNFGTVFGNMAGTLHSNIAWDLIPKGASFTANPIGRIFDNVTPMTYNDQTGYGINGSEIILTEARNIHIDFAQDVNNLTTITNGMRGQLLYIKSSTNRAIAHNANRIVLSDSYLQLSAYKGILLKCDGVKWIQVQDNSVIQGLDGERGPAGSDGKSAFELWKEIPGNENKNINDFFVEFKGAKVFVQINKPEVETGIPAIWVETIRTIASSSDEISHDAKFHIFDGTKWHKCQLESDAKLISYVKGNIQDGLVRTNISDELDSVNERLTQNENKIVKAEDVTYVRKMTGNINQNKNTNVQEMLDTVGQILMKGETDGNPSYVKISDNLSIIAGTETITSFYPDTISGAFTKNIDLNGFSLENSILKNIQVSCRCRTSFPIFTSYAFSNNILTLICNKNDIESCYIEWLIIAGFA